MIGEQIDKVRVIGPGMVGAEEVTLVRSK